MDKIPDEAVQAATIEELLRKESECRAEFLLARNARQSAQNDCSRTLVELQSAKRELYAAGFTGNIMRDETGERILSAIEPAPSPRAQAFEEAAEVADDFALEIFNGMAPAAHEAVETVAAKIRALSSQPVSDGWLPIETAPKDKTIIGFGRIVGVNLCYHNGKQWNKTELSASFQLSAQAITHWRPLPASPGASATRPTGGSDV